MKREMRYLLWIGLSVGGAGFFLFCFWRRKGKKTQAISGKYSLSQLHEDCEDDKHIIDTDHSQGEDDVKSSLYSTQNRTGDQINPNVQYQLITEQDEVDRSSKDSLTKTDNENDTRNASEKDTTWPKQPKLDIEEDSLCKTDNENDSQTASEKDPIWPEHQKLHIDEDLASKTDNENNSQTVCEEDTTWPKQPKLDIEEDLFSKTGNVNNSQTASEKHSIWPEQQKLDIDEDSLTKADNENDSRNASGKDPMWPEQQKLDEDLFCKTDNENDYQTASEKDPVWAEKQKLDIEEDSFSKADNENDSRNASKKHPMWPEQRKILINEDLLFDVRKIRKTICTNLAADAEKEQKFYFLSKLMALDGTARKCNIHEMTLQSEEDMDSYNDTTVSPNAAHPLDVLCEIMQNSCKNYICRQEIISKMSMCQFAIPMLLPAAGDTPHCTFMLWAMRDIIKRWRPQSLENVKGFIEGNLVNICMPFYSFVRLGSCNISKSKLLNYVLSPVQQTHNFFVHHDMNGGNITKRRSDGMVEISWHFPSGQKGLDVFSEPIAVANLRGDLESHNQQLQFLLSVSSAMFIFVESINEKQYNLISGLSENKDTCYFFIINGSNIKPGDETTKYLNKVLEKLKLKKMNVIVKNKSVTDTQIALKLQTAIRALIANSSRKLSLQEIAGMEIWNKFQIAVDEDFQICESAKRKAKGITDRIKDIAQYKKEALKLQGDLWRKLTKVEKELCKLRELGNRDPEEYKSELQAEIRHLRAEQSYQTMADSVRMFIDTMIGSSPAEKQLFIKWLQISLDEAGRSNLSMLQAEYREKQRDLSVNAKELKDIDQRIANSSLGVENFLRELGQFYEAAKYMREGGHPADEIHCQLPKIAADILLDGFPLELIDGDTSNIPLRWITDVLKEMDNRTGGQCRIRIITVLGVQSTGKSTLLNTMFGLQLPVASGRCTRGAFMTVITVEKDFQEDLGCQYFLVIDTEGLKSLELASLDGSYEHDNELATVAVGLSDITIVNMAMENTEEIKYILQIVVHAFLRMKEVGKKLSCQFVHQNVSDVSAHVKNQRSREKFLEQLNELTAIMAKMEKRSEITRFSDIIYCDLDKHSWYIPGLWHGTPPMASINTGYSENIQEFKKSIFEYLQSMPGKPQTIIEFTEWLKSLWDAVKHEKFIFSFRNRLVTEAYNQLCMEFSDWEWRFQKNAHRWMTKTETFIYNLSSDELGGETWNTIVDEMSRLLDKEERIMSQSLENYFEQDGGNAHLLDMFRGDFFRSVNFLREELENTLVATCEKTMRIQREKCKIQVMQEQYINIIEAKVAEIMEAKRRDMNLEQLTREFEMVWQNTVSTLQLSNLERQNVEQIIIHQLKQDMKLDEQDLNKLYNLTSLSAYTKTFEINQTHHYRKSSKETTLLQNEVSSLLRECEYYVSICANTSENYNDMLSQELLKIINRRLNSQDARHFCINKKFELDIKLHILGCAAPGFQKMHNDFVRKNDPRSCLETLKPQYFSIFRNAFEKRNECRRRAEQFCELCLKPAIFDHINRHLGKEVVEEVLQSEGSWELKSHTLFQGVLLKELLQKKSCEEYASYINNYETFVKEWMFRYILEYYKYKGDIHTLQLGIVQSLTVTIAQALKHLSSVQYCSVSVFFDAFCNILKKDLVLPQNNLKVVAFHSDIDVGKFIHDIEAYLPDLMKELQVEMTSAGASSVLSQLSLKPQEELVRKVVGCGNQCPFCKAPCEAGGRDHKEHFASIHRPRGLAQHSEEQTEALDHSICSTNVISNKSFSNADTQWRPHPYKDYRTIYPEWAIYPDTTANGSDYWKFVFTELNQKFADLYKAKPADVPEEWRGITEDQALKSLKTA